MNKRSGLLYACTALLALTLLIWCEPATAPAGEATPAAAATSDTAANETAKTACLACHGPYDKLISKTAGYNAWKPYGETASPHQYVPHKSKDFKDIPECTNCHKPHPLPPTASGSAAKARVSTKYCKTCHHTGVLACGTCHAIPKGTPTAKP